MRRSRPAPYTPPLTIKPLPALPSSAALTPSPLSSRQLVSSSQLKRARAVGRAHGYTRSADLTVERGANDADPSKHGDLVGATSRAKPRPLRHTQRKRSLSFSDSYSMIPSPQSASDVVDWYTSNVADPEPETAHESPPSEYELTPLSARSPWPPASTSASQPPLPTAPPTITNVKSAAMAFVSARRQEEEERPGRNGNVERTLGHALFGVRHQSVHVQVVDVPQLASSSADTTPSTSPRGRSTPLAAGSRSLAVPRRESTFMTDVSDSDGDVEEAFEQVAALLRARNAPMLVEEKGYRRKAEVFREDEPRANPWI